MIPHPQPLAPAFKRCCDSCINVPCKVLNRVPCLAQEKQENICEENGCTDVENCDEICQHSRLFSPLQMQEAKDEAARKAREDERRIIAERLECLEGIGSWMMLQQYIESLRSTQQQAGEHTAGEHSSTGGDGV